MLYLANLLRKLEVFLAFPEESLTTIAQSPHRLALGESTSEN